MPQLNPKYVSNDWSGVYSETKVDPWQCVFWNVRNLTTNPQRAGVTGNGVPLETRIHAVAKFVQLWAPDFLFVMEAGADGDTVAKALGHQLLSKYQVIASNTTETERYILILSPRAQKVCKNFGLYGTPLTGFRQPAFLRLELGKNQKVCFIVLHAPSPSYSLTKRLQVIEHFADEAANDGGLAGHCVFFMGDLNIQADEFNDLSTTMTRNGLDYVHEGPVWNNQPAATSIRTFKTIIKTGGDTDSQPYDQVWLRQGTQTVTLPSCFTFMPSMRIPSLGTQFPKWLLSSSTGVLTELQNTTFTPGWDLLPEKKKLNATNKVLTQYKAENEAIRSFATLFKRREMKSIIPERLLEAATVVERIVTEVDTKMATVLPGFTAQDDKVPNTSSPERCDHVLGLMQNALKVLPMANGLLRAATNGVEGLGVTEANGFELAISDHRPVAFSFHF